MYFSLNDVPALVWPALRFGSLWNGWATPVVTREVLADMLTTICEPHRWVGSDLWLGTPGVDLMPGEQPEFWDRISPSADGTYDLGQMGWTFMRVATCRGEALSSHGRCHWDVRHSAQTYRAGQHTARVGR